MGSSESKNESPSMQQARNEARIRAHNEELAKKKAQLETEKEQWEQQQIRERFWKESQLREEQKRKDALLEWQRQTELKTLKLQQQKMQKELEEQKVLQQMMKDKLQKQWEKEKLKNAKFKDERLLFQRVQDYQHQQFQQVQPTAPPSTNFLNSVGMRETVAVQQKASISPSVNTSSPLSPSSGVQQKVSPGSAPYLASCNVPKATAAAQQKLSPSAPSLELSNVPKATAATQQKLLPLALSSASWNVSTAAVTLQAKLSFDAALSPALSDVPRAGAAVQQEVPAAAQTVIKNVLKSKETPKSFLTRMNEANVKCKEWSIIDYIKDENFISKQISEHLLNLFIENNTTPFIARYRRHLTQGMNENKLREARHSYNQAKLIKQRAVTIVKDIDNEGQWTPHFHALVHGTKSLEDLEYIYSVFKGPKSKIVKTAIANGLEIVTKACLKNDTPPVDFRIMNLVQESVEGLKTEEQVKNGIVRLLADSILKHRRTFSLIQKLYSTHQFEIQTTKGKAADKLETHENIYKLYYNFTSSERDLKSDEICNINKGEALKALNVKINISEKFEREFKKQCLQQYAFVGCGPSLRRTLIEAAIDFAYKESIINFVAKKVRKKMNDRALYEAADRLAQSVKLHLLAPPVRGKIVLGINPGFQSGSKFAVVSEQGNVLETGTIYVDDPNNSKSKSEAERVLAKMICKHKCTIIVLGNGNGFKGIEFLLTHMIKKNKKIPSDVFYTIVDQSSATIHISGPKAALEFPDVEDEILCAVSIARRLQDPIAELVKIEPEQLTKEKCEQDTRRQLIIESVSYVGVDVNTASLSLLKNVAGLNEEKANSIIEWRRSRGPFTNRNDLLKVKGIDTNTFKQCAGFIRIVPETAVAIGGEAFAQNSFNYLDQTWIHPESYDIARCFLEAAQCNVLQLGTSSFIFTINCYAQTGFSVLAEKFGTTEETIKMIVAGLKIKKGQDIRGEQDSAIFRKSLLRFNELNNGDLLTGVVTNLTEFGTFVDVGAEKDGLVHKSCMNGLTVEVDQLVEVRVCNIQKERGRLGLALIQCI